VKKVAYAAVLAACFGVSGVAQAADLGYPGSLKDTPYWSPADLWTGWYVGGHIGGAWGDVDVTDNYDYYGDPTTKSKFNTSGLLSGGQIGYNFKSGRIVYGLEADLGYLSLSGSKAATLLDYDDSKCHGSNTTECSLNARYSSSGGLYGDITARLGYTPTDNTLFYLKGGPVLGWTIGAGVEYAVTPSLSIKAEYQHFDFGSTSFSHNGDYKFHPDIQDQCVAPDPHWCSRLRGNADVDLGVDAVTIGLNYRLNGTGGGLK
jgi:outer membrane immunogenic protein